MSTTFNTLNDISKKQRMLFLADSMGSLFSPIAYATSANLSFSADDVDVSNKMDGGWATSMQGKKSAEVSVDALCAYKNGLTSEIALQAGWNTDKLYAFLYIMTTVEEQADGSTKLKYDTSVPYYYGYMKLASLDLTSDNGDVAKFSVSGKSCGTVQLAKPGSWLYWPTTINSDDIVFHIAEPNGVYVGEFFNNVPASSLEAYYVEISNVHEEEISVETDNGSFEITTSVELAIGDTIKITFDDSVTVAKYVITMFDE